MASSYLCLVLPGTIRRLHDGEPKRDPEQPIPGNLSPQQPAILVAFRALRQTVVDLRRGSRFLGIPQGLLKIEFGLVDFPLQQFDCANLEEGGFGRLNLPERTRQMLQCLVDAPLALESLTQRSFHEAGWSRDSQRVPEILDAVMPIGNITGCRYCQHDDYQAAARDQRVTHRGKRVPSSAAPHTIAINTPNSGTYV